MRLLRSALTAFLVALLIGCKTVFVTPQKVVLGAPKPTNNGYLRISATSNLAALSASNNKSIASGYKYLSITTSIAGKDITETEFPLALYDIESKTTESVTGVAISHGEYVNFDSMNQISIKITVRAIPKTIATVYSDAFKNLQAITSGLPLTDLLGNNPYLSIAGKLLSNMADAANEGNKKTSTYETIGVTGGGDGFPTDGRTVVVFLSRDDTAPQIPAKDTLVVQDGVLYVKGSGSPTKYMEMPYLLLSSGITDYRPPIDWGIAGYSCSDPNIADKAKHLETAIHGGNMIDKQAECESLVLQKLNSIIDASRTIDGLDLAKSDDILKFSNILYRWKMISQKDDDYWNRYYRNTVNILNNCFQRQMRPTLEIGNAFDIVSAALDAANSLQGFKPASRIVSDAEQQQLEECIKNIKKPIVIYSLKEGGLYRNLIVQKQMAESYLLPRDQRLANSYVSAVPTNRAELLAQIDARVQATDCQTCIEALTQAKKAVEDQIAATKQTATTMPVEKQEAVQDLAVASNNAKLLLNFSKKVHPNSPHNDEMAGLIEQADSGLNKRQATAEEIRRHISEVTAKSQEIKAMLLR
jgi:hypothetical protein